MLFNVLLVAAALATAATMFIAEVHEEAKEWAIHEQEEHLKTFWELLRIKGQSFEISNGKLLVGNYIVNGNNELPDKLRDIFGCTATIFMGDIRVSTNVRMSDDRRAIGTRLQGPPRDALFRDGKPFRGKALILGIPYLTAYDPIRNQKGEVIGALYVGIKESKFFAAYEKLRYKVITVTTLLMLVFSMLAALLFRFRRQAEAALHESRERLQLQFDHMPIACVVSGIDCKIQTWNPAAEKVFGYTAGETIGKSANDLIVPSEIRAEVNSVWRTLLEKDETIHRTHENITKNHQTIFCKWTRTPLKDIGGNIIGFISMAEDITELKKTDEALREALTRYQNLAAKLDEKQHLLQTLINSIPDLIFYKDLNGKYLGCNKAFAAFAGHIEDELKGLTDFDLFPRKIATFFREMDRQMLNISVPQRNEEWVHYPDGRHVLLETLKTPFYGSQDQCLGLIGISRDITERHQAEEHRNNLEAQLNQAHKMEAIGQLAGGIAHDFNNILTVIIGYSEIIFLNADRDHPLRRHMEQILTSANRAADLTAGLLAFSRKQLLHPKPLDLGEVAHGLRKMLLRLIPEDIDFKTIVSEQNLTIMADRGQIEQVIMNLVTNAKDAMPNGGALTIEISAADINEDFHDQHGFGEPGRYCCIVISDTGHGMDVETRKRIFEPFFTTKEAGKGTGLGMAIIYGIVKQHNGFITVDSKPGGGSTFRVYLPLAGEVVQEVRGASKEEHPPGGVETVLLAEDDEAVRELHSMILEDTGYTIIQAVDGQDALDKFMKHQSEVSILITDVIMPKINGKRLYEEIRKIRPDMKVLMMSGYTKDVIIERGILEDEYSFMTKPVKPYDLLKTLRHILDNQ